MEKFSLKTASQSGLFWGVASYATLHAAQLVKASKFRNFAVILGLDAAAFAMGFKGFAMACSRKPENTSQLLSTHATSEELLPLDTQENWQQREKARSSTSLPTKER